jgi:hypothetical protein
VQPWRAPVPADEKSRWYGHKILIADGVGYALIFLGFAGGGEAVVVLGGLTTMLGSPLIHTVNGEGGNALLSLPLHVLLPIGTAALLVYLKSCPSPPCDGPDFERILGGLALGVAAATLIDAAFIARTRRKRDHTPAAAWAPRLGVTEDGFTAGVGGQF